VAGDAGGILPGAPFFYVHFFPCEALSPKTYKKL
jgi:hypothetical protein